jgi:hypothetical protein
MAAFSDYLEDTLLNHTLRNVAYPVVPSVYVALFISATSDTTTTGGTGQGEVNTAGTGYARQGPVVFSAPSGGQVSNTVDIVFPTALAGWGTVTHVAIFTAVSGLQCLYHAPLATPKTVNTGDTFRFLAGQLIVGLN